MGTISCIKTSYYLLVVQLFWFIIGIKMLILFAIVEHDLYQKFSLLFYILIPMTILIFIIYLISIVSSIVNNSTGKFYLLIIFAILFAFMTFNAVVFLTNKDFVIRTVNGIFIDPKYEALKRALEIIGKCCPKGECIDQAVCLKKLTNEKYYFMIGMSFVGASLLSFISVILTMSDLSQ